MSRESRDGIPSQESQEKEHFKKDISYYELSPTDKKYGETKFEGAHSLNYFQFEHGDEVFAFSVIQHQDNTLENKYHPGEAGGVWTVCLIDSVDKREGHERRGKIIPNFNLGGVEIIKGELYLIDTQHTARKFNPKTMDFEEVEIDIYDDES